MIEITIGTGKYIVTEYNGGFKVRLIADDAFGQLSVLPKGSNIVILNQTDNV